MHTTFLFLSSLENRLRRGTFLSDTLQKGTVDTIVQLLCHARLWPNRNRWRRTSMEVRKLFGEGEHTMSEFATKSIAQGQQEQTVETRTAVKRTADFTIAATAVAVLAILGTVA